MMAQTLYNVLLFLVDGFALATIAGCTPRRAALRRALIPAVFLGAVLGAALGGDAAGRAQLYRQGLLLHGPLLCLGITLLLRGEHRVLSRVFGVLALGLTVAAVALLVTGGW